jgi:hypothetical protein
LINGKAYLP